MDIRDITKNDFRNWLESKDNDEIIGRAFHCKECPVANFYREILRTEYVFVSFGSMKIDDESYDLPNWATSFIEEVDDMADAEYDQGEVTAKRARTYISL